MCAAAAKVVIQLKASFNLFWVMNMSEESSLFVLFPLFFIFGLTDVWGGRNLLLG